MPEVCRQSWGMVTGDVKSEGGGENAVDEISSASAPGGEFSLHTFGEHSGQAYPSISLRGGTSFNLKHSRTRPELAHMCARAPGFFFHASELALAATANSSKYGARYIRYKN